MIGGRVAGKSPDAFPHRALARLIAAIAATGVLASASIRRGAGRAVGEAFNCSAC